MRRGQPWGRGGGRNRTLLKARFENTQRTKEREYPRHFSAVIPLPSRSLLISSLLFISIPMWIICLVNGSTIRRYLYLMRFPLLIGGEYNGITDFLFAPFLLSTRIIKTNRFYFNSQPSTEFLSLFLNRINATMYSALLTWYRTNLHSKFICITW